MFYTYAILATIFYALNNNLMAELYRKESQVWAVSLRGFGIGVAMLPILFFVPHESFHSLINYIPLLLLACVLTLFANISVANAYRNLPIGIASAVSMSFSSVFSGVFSFLILNEKLVGLEIMVLCFILVCILAIGFTDMRANVKINIKKGVFYSAIFGFLVSFAFIITAHVARATNPLVVGYFWETGVGFVGIAIIFVNSIIKKEAFLNSSIKYFPKIILYSIPAAIAAACYSLGVSSGSVAIVAAILGTMMVANSIFAWLINKENITKIQWLLVIIISLLVVALKFVGK